MPRRRRCMLILSRCSTGLALAWLCFCSTRAAEGDGQGPAAPAAFLENAGFEQTQRLAAPPPGNELGAWNLKSALQAPAGWTLSTAYPGDLEVVEGGAFEGQRFLRLAAGAKRAAHLYQACSRCRYGLTYKIALRYRGGPVELKVYEYDAAGVLKADRAFAVGVATPARAGAWAALEGIYAMPSGIASVCLAVTVPGGAGADLDDVRVEGLGTLGATLNVHDAGASGSDFSTTADCRAGSDQIVLRDVGDFEVGQQVALSGCNPGVSDLRLWAAEAASINEFGGTSAAPETQVEVRGYDGSSGSWTVYILDIAGTRPPTFRWSDDLARTWKETQVPISDGWHKLSGGVEVKLGPRDWTKPCLVTFSGRDQLVSTILRIEGTTLTLADPVPREAKQCQVQHTDSAALQAAFDRAVAAGRNLFIPAGRYRLTRGLILRNADGITVEGENEERTILDISGGTGPCISVQGGTSVTLRGLRFRGFSGFAERGQMGSLPLPGYAQMWGFYVKHCNAVEICSPERLLIENCHATGMSAECFYSNSSSRSGNHDPATYTKSIVYRNCTVTDCARNAFNNNDMAENTAVLYCRVQDVGGCTWEGASRFVKFVGNYVRNAGTVAIGNICSRDANYDILPSGQHIVADNTFEQEMVYGGCAIRSCAGSTPVIISNNIFVNFNTSAIEANGSAEAGELPAANTIITGNAIDLTCVRNDSKARIGITVTADDATVSDNQIYVRGEIDSRVTGIALQEPACNLLVHDNIVRGCATGLRGGSASGRVAEVIDARTFRSTGLLPWPRRRSHGYRGWNIAWNRGGNALPGPAIAGFDADAGVFRLAADADLAGATAFAIYSPEGPTWSIHHNAISNCTQPVFLDVFGGPTAVFADNLLARGGATGVRVALEVRGAFRVTANQFAGYDEDGAHALLLHLDRFGKPPRFICRDNVFDGCRSPIAEGGAGVWAAVVKGGNVYDGTLPAPDPDHGSVPSVAASAAAAPSVFVCRRTATPPVIDGKLADWSWTDDAPVAVLNQTHERAPSGGFTARGLALYDDAALYLALDVRVPAGEGIRPDNGVEWSLLGVDDKQPTPVFVLWCKVDGELSSLTAMGASAAQAATLRDGTRYAVARSDAGWTCEWCVPWAALGVSPAAPPRTWRMNLGVRSENSGLWLAWVPTASGRICAVEEAGEMHLSER